MHDLPNDFGVGSGKFKTLTHNPEPYQQPLIPMPEGKPSEEISFKLLSKI